MTFAMDDDPDDTAFLEHLASLNIEEYAKYPERALNVLFAKIDSTRHAERYRDLLFDGGDDLKSLLLQCLRPTVREYLADSDLISQNRYESHEYGNFVVADSYEGHGRSVAMQTSGDAEFIFTSSDFKTTQRTGISAKPII